MSEYPIPKDLKLLWREAHYALDEDLLYAGRVKTLIERIAAAEGRVAELEAENARLRKWWSDSYDGVAMAGEKLFEAFIKLRDENALVKALVSDEWSIWFPGKNDFFAQIMASRAKAMENTK